MPRLIDADALLDAMRDEEFQTFVPLDEIDSVIDKAPTIDAEPVRHGRWGETQVIGYDGIHPVYGKPCSKCGYETELYKPNYCPNCGAKMNGGKDNDCE